MGKQLGGRVASIASSRLGRVAAALAVLCVLIVQGCGQSAHHATSQSKTHTGAPPAAAGALPPVTSSVQALHVVTTKLDRACSDLHGLLHRLGTAETEAQAQILRQEYPKLLTLGSALATMRLPAHQRSTVVPLQRALNAYRGLLRSEIRLDRRLVMDPAGLRMPNFGIGMLVHDANAATRQTLAMQKISPVIGSPCLDQLPVI
jgi:hypothetical protein